MSPGMNPARPHSVEPSSVRVYVGPFKLQDPPLGVEAASKADQISTGTHDAMAGQDDRDRVFPVGGADCARRFRSSQSCGLLPVRCGLTVRDRGKRPPRRLLKLGSAQIERQIKRFTLAVKVFLELQTAGAQYRVIGLRRNFIGQTNPVRHLLRPSHGAEPAIGCY